MNESNSPIFIVGRPRSGTTLMASLLDAHPRLSILPLETEIFYRWFGKCLEFDLHHSGDFQRFWSLFISESRFHKLDVDPEEILPPLNHRDALGVLKSILIKTGEIDAKRFDKARWGEKTPIHYKFLKLIFDAFPQAQVIMMLRDPRAILASLLKTPWNKETTEESARNWMEFVSIMCRWCSDPRVHVVQFEQLTTQTEPILQDVCRWLGEKYTPAMLDRSQLTHRLKTKKNWGLEHRRKALGPINADGIEKWKGELTSRQIKLTEHICGPFMRDLAYEPATRGLGFPLGMIYNLKDGLLRPEIHFRRLTRKLSRVKSGRNKIVSLE